MSWDEIEIPKELREFMLEEAELTSLGQKNGANKKSLLVIFNFFSNKIAKIA